MDIISPSSDIKAPAAGPSKRTAKARKGIRSPTMRQKIEAARAALVAKKTYVPHALNDVSRAQLRVAIGTASEECMREVLVALADGAPTVPERVYNMLITAHAGAQKAAPDAAEKGAARAPKRTRTEPAAKAQLQECANCKMDYDAGAERLGGDADITQEIMDHNNRKSTQHSRLAIAFEDWDEGVHIEIMIDTQSTQKKRKM
ncbi:hypothetical protein C2E23DRAFT_881863 [Lenzites betulinus]|nr:hypothetical protein C2E23DRAFT_881863 [Lenzites betulinus]